MIGTNPFIYRTQMRHLLIQQLIARSAKFETISRMFQMFTRRTDYSLHLVSVLRNNLSRYRNRNS